MPSSTENSSATKVFNFLIRIPRVDIKILEEPIGPVKLELDEKTKARDAIRLQLEDKIAGSKIHDLYYEYVKGKEISARNTVKSKLAEIKSVRSVINRAEKVLSIDRINARVCNTERYIVEHETLPLEEVRKRVRGMDRLNQRRVRLENSVGRLCYCADSKDGIERILELKEKAKEKLKILTKELDILEESAVIARAAVLELEKKYESEMKQIEQLKARSRAAEDVCRVARAKLESVRTKHRRRISLLSDCIEDTKFITGDPEELSDFCKESVEKFMKLWNEDEEFRRQYVRMNEEDKMKRNQETTIEDAVSETETINPEPRKFFLFVFPNLISKWRQTFYS
ncbi:hypothetical protein ACP275_03G017100 [Erythranthe tilingii]